MYIEYHNIAKKFRWMNVHAACPNFLFAHALLVELALLAIIFFIGSLAINSCALKTVILTKSTKLMLTNINKTQCSKRQKSGGVVFINLCNYKTVWAIPLDGCQGGTLEYLWMCRGSVTTTRGKATQVHWPINSTIFWLPQQLFHQWTDNHTHFLLLL